MSEDEQSLAWWWIDYLENEMDPGVEKDLEFLLESCEEDRSTFEYFRLIREWLRFSDPIGDWPIEERLTRVRCKVMREIERDGQLVPENRATNLLSV